MAKATTKAPKMVRLATVKATGRRYLVQQVDFRANRVHCWGEVTASRGRSTEHGPSQVFDLAAVTLAQVEKTDALVRSLFEETVEARERAGAIVRESGRKHRNVYIVGQESAAVIALARDLGIDLATATERDRIELRALAAEQA